MNKNYNINESIILLNNNDNNDSNYGFIAKRNIQNIIQNNNLAKETGSFENNGNNYLQLDNTASSIDDYYKGMIIKIKSGEAKDEYRIILNYVGSEKIILVDSDFINYVERGDEYHIFDDNYVGFFYNENENKFIACTNNDDNLDNLNNLDNIRTTDFHCNNGIFDNNVLANSFSTRSDKRLKKNIKDISYQEANNIINNIQGCTYDWKNKLENKSSEVGFIAQDIEKILPNVVNEDNNGYKSIEYQKIIPYLVETIKGLEKKVNNLEDKLSNLEGKKFIA